MMKRFDKSILIIAACLSACSSNQTPKETVEEEKMKENSVQSTEFDPGAEYRLVWSDEFEGTELYGANWSRQVETAGRFNDEWQRYTDSPDNAYVEDGSLVIKAMHEGDTHGMDQYTSARLHTAGKQSW
ncbi:MAG: hypothetical protein AAGC88_08350 [Bacteroidota bacterium]